MWPGPVFRVIDSARPGPVPLGDGIAIRRNNDLFVRPVVSGSSFSEAFENHISPTYFEDERFDSSVRLSMRSGPHLECLGRNSVIIKIIPVGDEAPIYAQGAIVSASIVFTCANPFKDIKVKMMSVLFGPLNNLSEHLAKRETIPDDILAGFNPRMGVSSIDEMPWTSYPDFAVVRCLHPLPLEVEPFKLSTEMPLVEGTPVAMIGSAPPLPPSVVLRNLFPPSFLVWVDSREMGEEDQNKYMADLITAGFHGFTTKVACFGAVKYHQSSSESSDIFITTMTSLPGMSGAPVVSVARPDELLGLSVGSFRNFAGACVISANCQGFATAYAHYTRNVMPH